LIAVADVLLVLCKAHQTRSHWLTVYCALHTNRLSTQSDTFSTANNFRSQSWTLSWPSFSITRRSYCQNPPRVSSFFLSIGPVTEFTVCRCWAYCV